MRMHPSIVEATRLTREGRLGDATALLREMLGRIVHAPPVAEPVVLHNQSAQLPAPSGAPDVQAAEKVRHVGTGSFESLVHASPQGRMTYKLYVPAAIAAGAPLIVMLHGCTQTANDFARGTGMNRLADEAGFLVAYPEQPKSANPSRCWNWFRPGDQRRDEGEPALIAGLTREIVERHGIDPARVFVAGLSAGGATAAIMGETYPDLFAAVGVHSGLACGAANDIAGAMMAMRRGGGKATARPSSVFIPTITFHGDRDSTVDKVNSDEIIERANRGRRTPLSSEILRGGDPAGRTYVRRVLRDEQGQSRLEQWTIHDAGHAWAGGDPAGSYADPAGPDASREMIRFFLSQSA